MSRPHKSPADIALTAWRSAGIKQRTISHDYQPKWNTWQEWCDANGIAPLGATHDDYTQFGSDQPKWTKTLHEVYSATLYQPYLRAKRPSPARRPARPDHLTTGGYATQVKLFQAWCKTHRVSSLPAQPEHLVSFLHKLAKSHTKGVLINAAWGIGRMHTQANFSSPSESPTVKHALKQIQGTPRPPERSSQYYLTQDHRRAHWTNWCRTHGYEPEKAKAANFRQYIQELASKPLTRTTLMGYRTAISEMYNDPAITSNKKTRALINASPKTIGQSRNVSPSRQEAEAEIQEILHTEAELLDHHTTSLPIEKRIRVAQAIGHADVLDNTLLDYVKYSWLPFKRWCKQNDTSTKKATPPTVAAFLCDFADENNPHMAAHAHVALLHIYGRVRPNDNPADNHTVRRTVNGLKREQPRHAQQAAPIGDEELNRIIGTAHLRKGNERHSQIRLRAAVDIALICTMYDALLRGKEASQIKWDDVKPAPDGHGGSIVTIPHSKTDQLHEGVTLYLTKYTTDAIWHMQAVRHEMGIGDSEDTRIFRLGPNRIYERIREACQQAGLIGRYTMHSPRVGGAQDLALDNVSEVQIMNIGRWKSSASSARYTSKARASQNAVAQREQRRKQTKQAHEHQANDYAIRPPHSKARLGH